VSRTRIVPLSPEQDTAGPFARTVADAAAVLTVIAGSDPEDAATQEADAHRTDYVAALDAKSLAGVRIGVLRGIVTSSPAIDAVFDRSLGVLRAAGAELVEVELPAKAQRDALSDAELDALLAEFRDALNRYLATTPPGVEARTLDALIAFNKAHPQEMPLFAQELFEMAAKQPDLTDPVYQEKRATARRLAGAEGLDRMFAAAQVQVIVSPTLQPAPVIDPVNGERFGGSPTDMPAVAGYPHLTVPMGEVSGLPIGLSFIGPRWSDAQLLSYGHAFEQRVQYHPRPGFASSLLQVPETVHALERR
jgi:amidase